MLALRVQGSGFDSQCRKTVDREHFLCSTVVSNWLPHSHVDSYELYLNSLPTGAWLSPCTGGIYLESFNAKALTVYP